MTENFSELTFEQIKIDQTKEFQIKITESLVNEFAKLSGDFSPIHMNDEDGQSTKIIKIESKITNKKNEILLNGVGRIIVRDD